MRNKTTARLHADLVIPMISAVTCLAVLPAHAAKPNGMAASSIEKPVSSLSKHGLKLDTMLLNPDLANELCDDADLTLQSPKPALYSATPHLAKLSVNGTTDRMFDMTVVADNASNTAPPVRPAGTSMPSRTWEIMASDKTLNAVLARWAAIEGWQLAWELPIDYVVEMRATLTGAFDEVVGVVADSMDGAEMPFKAIFYAGNKVLRIVKKGAE